MTRPSIDLLQRPRVPKVRAVDGRGQHGLYVWERHGLSALGASPAPDALVEPSLGGLGASHALKLGDPYDGEMFR